MKKIVLIVPIGLLLLSISLIMIKWKSDKGAALNNFSQTAVGSEKIDDQGEVTVTARPLDLSPDAGLRFEIVLNTHSVELDTDLVANAGLFLGDRVYQPLSWQGDPPGGHHRQGILTFPALPKIPDTVTLRIKNVGAVDARTFSWTIKN